MSTVIFGGAGFVGLNLAQHLLETGRAVTIFDRRAPQQAALATFAACPGQLTVIEGDVLDAAAVTAAIRPGTDVVVMGAAITSGPERDASDPASVLSVNLMSQIPMLQAAHAVSVRRVINLSSAAAYGAAGERVALLDEKTPVDPIGLYPITKWASERISSRLGNLWGLDVVSARLSGVFGPWEHETGVRDTPSPHFQVLRALEQGQPALLPRPMRWMWPRRWPHSPSRRSCRSLFAMLPGKRHGLCLTGARSWHALFPVEFAGWLRQARRQTSISMGRQTVRPCLRPC
jgi:UDP-glucose 4-epimerase